jgi:hypothetical protein
MVRVFDQQEEIIESAVAIEPEKLAIDALPNARTAIERAMEILDLEIAQIRHDLGERGPAENARWWSKATAAQRIKAKKRVRLQRKLHDVTRLIKAERNRQNLEKRKSQDSRFIQLVRQRFGEEIFLELWDIVNAEFDEVQK